MKLKSLLTAIICIIPCVSFAVTLDAPHGTASGFVCATCHATHREQLGAPGYNNICLSCHRAGFPKGGQRPFSVADAANPFGTMTTVAPAAAYQTSHNWSAPEVSPAAGAGKPLLPQMTTAKLSAKSGNRLACIRCHNQHDNSYPPFLRVDNSRDQLCLDCHRVRNTRNHTAGSHPVNFNYTGATSQVKTKPAMFNNPPVNANPGNSTSDLAARLAKKGGTLLCTTCHGVHYSDSASATYDSYTSYYSLTRGDGNLLMTDMRGATADGTNLCTNCHAGKKAHNSRGQNVQCTDCHGAHVAFDKNDPNNLQRPNVWLINRYMNLSTVLGSAKLKPVYFQSTSAKNYKDAGGNGVCQSCHVVPTGAGYPPEHSAPGSIACNDCHSHSNPSGSFSASAGSCNSCHGYPPRANSAGGPNGYAVYNGTPSPFTNESTGGHASHAGGSPYSKACVECHQGNTHRSGTFQDLFKDTTGRVAALYGALPTFNGTNPQAPTCSNVYCHSDGAPRDATLVPVITTKTIPGWANGRGAIIGTAGECRTCHGDATTLVTNSHGKHLAASIGCVSCHSGTASGNTTIKNQVNHANGIKDVIFSGFTAAGRGWNVTAATCSVVYCHSNGQGANGTGVPSAYASPRWGGGSLNCGSCHVDQATDLTGTGSHRVHTVVTGANLDCARCHLGYTKTASNPASHVNGFIDLDAAGINYTQGSGSVHPVGNGYGSCSTTVCHGSGVPVWGGSLWSTTDQCGKCHSSPTAVTASTPYYNTSFPVKNTSNTDVKTGAHTAHITASERLHPGLVCVDCHGAVNLNDPTHMNGVANFNWSVLARTGNLSPNYNPVTGQCTNVYCHGNAMPGGDTSGSNRSPIWSNPNYLPQTLSAAGCGTCHGFPPPTSVGHPAVTIPAGFPNTPLGTTCACHGNINQQTAGPTTYANVFLDPALHINGTLEGGNCNGCHGYPPVSQGFAGTLNNWTGAKIEDYPGGGGAHSINSHVSKSARPSDGFAYCNKCHNPADHQTSPQTFNPSENIKVRVNQSVRLEAAKQAKYSSNRLDGAAHQTGTCTNISCHFGATPKWDQAH